MRSRVATAVVSVIVRFSIAVNVGVIVPPVNVAVRVSVPPAPLSTSEEPRVCAAETKEPSNESAPAVPVKGFALVVSGQVARKKIIF